MKLDYQGQTALVTGASAGIGRAIAVELAHRGVGRLILVARRRERLEDLANQLNQLYPKLDIQVRACDLSDRTATDLLLKNLRQNQLKVDLLVNNAGLGAYGLFENADWERLSEIIQLNIISLTYLTHRLLPDMLLNASQHPCGILNIGSIAGLLISPGRAVYSASKYYVDAFSEGLRLELNGTGIVVTQVCPGPVESEFSRVAGSGAHPASRPAWLEISAERCAQDSLNAWAKGQALVLPGAKLSVLGQMMRLVPAPLMRVSLPGLRRILKPNTD